MNREHGAERRARRNAEYAGIRERIPDAPPQVEGDVVAFLDALTERGLVEQDDAA